MSWPQWYAVSSPPYSIGGPIDNAVLQHAIEATYFPTSLIWFPTHDAAEKWAKAKGGGAPAGVPGTEGVNTALNTGTNAASALGQFFGGSSAGWLLRTAEIALGLVLIAVGVAKITKAVPVATAIAKKVA